MGCCGQTSNTPRRPAAVAARPTVGPPPPAPAAVTAGGEEERGASGVAGTTLLRYLHGSPIRVQGPNSGARYEFSAAAPVAAVHRADAAALLQTGYFRVAG